MGPIDDFNAWAARDGWSTRVSDALDFQSPKLKECLALWTRAATATTLPTRADLSPRAMKGFLPQVVMWDVVPDPGGNRFRLRVMGTALQAVWGHGNPGSFLDEAIPEPFRTRWQRIAQLSIDLRRPLRCRGDIQYGNKTHYRSETFQAPLAGEDGAVEAILFVHIVSPKTAEFAVELAQAL